jgi:hypothetical protein
VGESVEENKAVDGRRTTAVLYAGWGDYKNNVLDRQNKTEDEK